MSAAALKTQSMSALIEIASLVTEWTGNRFLDKHYVMIESRLMRRIIQLGLTDTNEYYKYLLENMDEEKDSLISLLTTHHTYFFRESSHFDFIRDNIIPSLAEEIKSRPDKTLRVLSMACSKGHEVYSLATYLDYHLKRLYPWMKYKFSATDVDVQSVEYAKNGVYPFEELKRIPMQYLEGYWVRGKGDIANFAKIKNEIKSHCDFYSDNLLSISPQKQSSKYDLVLCRHVFIYFDQHQAIQSTTSATTLFE